MQENNLLFLDLPEFEENEYIGDGIKRIKAYFCDIPLDKLIELRNKFWESRKSHKRIWQVIRNVCETDSATAEQLLYSANLVALDGSIRCVVDPYSGEVFNIPNFCICDPIYKRHICKEDIAKEEKIINLELLYVFKNATHQIQISNKAVGLEIKNLFCKLEKIDLNEHQIRLLSKGQEIKNDSVICQFNISDGDKIQVSCVKYEDMDSK